MLRNYERMDTVSIWQCCVTHKLVRVKKKSEALQQLQLQIVNQYRVHFVQLTFILRLNVQTAQN